MYLIVHKDLTVETGRGEPSDAQLTAVFEERAKIFRYDHLHVCFREAVVAEEEQAHEEEDGFEDESILSISEWRRL